MNVKKINKHILIQKFLQQSKLTQKSKNSSYTSLSRQIQMTIDLGDGQEFQIIINAKDDPLTLARKFCFEHNLDTKIINLLSKKIKYFMSNPQTENYEPNLTQNSTNNDSKFIKTYNDRTVTQNSIKQNSIPVFERLYNYSKLQKKINNNTQQNHSKQDNSRYSNNYAINHGVLIYERNTRLTEQNKKKIEKRIEQLKNIKQSQLTFKPQINQVSKLMIEKMREQIDMASYYEKNKELQQQKMNNIKRQKEISEMQQCTFQPKINNKLNRYQLSRSTDRFNILFQDWNLRQQRKENNKLEYSKKNLTFHPKVNKLSDMIINGVPFDERLKRYQVQKHSREQNIKKAKFFEEIKENEFGKPLYKPQIGRPPQNRNTSNLPIGDYLYNHRYQRQSNIQKLRSQSTQKLIKTNLKSQKLYEINKFQALKQIFELLDSDNDKIISSTKINISQLDPKLLKIFAPLLAEMEEVNVELDQEEFIQSADKLFKTLTINQKNLIMNNNKVKKISEVSFYQPSLNQKSLEIANQLRSINKPGISLYQFCEQRKLKKQQKINQQREIKQILELEECTFHPNLNLSRYRK